ncbi:MAG: hypothetical protein ABIY52_08645 [Gemmatimonadaceae bacterium]
MTLRLGVIGLTAMAVAVAVVATVVVRRRADLPPVIDAVWPPGREDCPLQAWYRGAIRPDSTCVPRVLSDTAFRWKHAESTHVSIHYLDSTSAAADPHGSLSRAESALADNLALLGASEYPRRVHIFYAATREQYERVTGGPGGGWTVAWAQAITLRAPLDEKDPAERHELMHVVSMNVWGVNPLADYWIREGLAVFATERSHPGAIDSTARAMLADGRAKPLSTYREAFFAPGVDNYPAYMLCGSFVKFLYARGGRERLRELWVGGIGVAERVYGASADSLEAEWKRSLAEPRRSRAPTN